MDHLDIIKSRILLSEVVSKKVRLIKRGENFIGLCPFHHEKTPSFSVNDIKGLYYCFGCSAHGDVFEFVSQTEGLNFKDVVKNLALIAGVDLPQYQNEEDDKLLLALELATDWFAQKVHKVTSYLKERHVSSEMINKFKIGYAPTAGLKEHLNSLGIKDNILLQIGLINKNSYDYFRDRLIFPIFSTASKTLAFGGRILHSEKQPKYLNSPETKIFKKKENLYGMNFALGEIRRKHLVFVVEGYLDVIAFHQAGISNTVAPLGTAISEDHIKKLWRSAQEISICMDGDSAGHNAALRVAKLVLPLLEPGYTIKFVTLINNKDPSDICNELEYNKENILTVLNNLTKLHSEYLWNSIIDSIEESHSQFTPEKYSLLEYRCMEYTNLINNTNIRRYYRDYFYKKVNALRRNLKNATFSSKITKRGDYLYDKSPDVIKAESNQAIILRIIIDFPEILTQPVIFEQFSNFEFVDISMRTLQRDIVDIVSRDGDINKKTFLQELEQHKVIQDILIKTEVLNSQLLEKESAKTVWNNIVLISELHELEKEKIEARLKGNFELEERLIVKIREIENSIQEMQMEFIHKLKVNI
ncbi:MAG: DNA primase [Wolbachia endosymbiont of Fragariocoptes setiger]|nr:DNA primase [Wolbachia endosymbiont of Fragariocoptes setiger]